MTLAHAKIATAKANAMKRPRPCPARPALAAALILSLSRAAAAGSLLEGEYVCAYGCRTTDANPTLAVHGHEVDCMNEYGGLFRGKLLSRTSVGCFRQTGRLDRDGMTLTWTNGTIWKRHGPARY
jgi:hypothetical protein